MSLAIKKFLCFLCFSIYAVAAFAAPPKPMELDCSGTKASVEFEEEQLSPRQYKAYLTIKGQDGYTSILTFSVRSFGMECRSNILNWRGFVVWQTACPLAWGPATPFEACDKKNYFGIAKGSHIMLVPSANNGRLAAELFHYPYQKKAPDLAPVKIYFKTDDNLIK
ncbi:hypothetical protein ACO0LC_01190 [Undibacterium sp. JH2W]|uniref:hypothetical protein n=1 Tax=Undibacterium sp. JH2W TaxID=3413037 RepID=UPI003BF3A54C